MLITIINLRNIVKCIIFFLSMTCNSRKKPEIYFYACCEQLVLGEENVCSSISFYLSFFKKIFVSIYLLF